jgi:hypothetical protein
MVAPLQVSFRASKRSEHGRREYGKGRAKRGSEEMGSEVIQLKICAIAGLYQRHHKVGKRMIMKIGRTRRKEERTHQATGG